MVLIGASLIGVGIKYIGILLNARFNYFEYVIEINSTQNTIF